MLVGSDVVRIGTSVDCLLRIALFSPLLESVVLPRAERRTPEVVHRAVQVNLEQSHHELAPHDVVEPCLQDQQLALFHAIERGIPVLHERATSRDGHPSGCQIRLGHRDFDDAFIVVITAGRQTTYWRPLFEQHGLNIHALRR